jgi:hypothetical protein
MLAMVLTRSHVSEPARSIESDLAIMELPSNGERPLPPCYRAADCGIDLLIP